MALSSDNLVSACANPRIPAEWEPAEAIWIAWPHNKATWPGRFEKIPAFFRDWARSIADVLPTRILVQPEQLSEVKSFLASSTLELVPIRTNDCWIRDYGPTFLQIDNRQVAIDWRYNAWGGKYPPWEDDDRAASQIADHLKMQSSRQPICMEGGAIETDGGGRLLTNANCLAVESRNPGWTMAQITQHFQDTIGITEWVSIDGGLVGDDTDGHIDQLARFIDIENIVVAVCDEPSDANAELLEHNFRQLSRWARNTSPKVNVHRLPIPPARFVDGSRVPESYCNFLWLGDQCLQLPAFGDARSDDMAKEIVSNLVDVPVQQIDCTDLIWGLGAMHCASLNQPRLSC